MASTPYHISVPDSELAKLHQRLDLTTFPDEFDATDQWPYGAPLSDMKRLTKHWRETFDWQATERHLNEIPQFTADVSVEDFGSIKLHFVHQPSPVPNAIPLLFVHGWPGSFIEVSKLLPLLKGGNGKPAFHVVAPSLPNFGFSQGIKKPGFALDQYAEVCHNLMVSLGYGQYVTQGGDWGFFITRTMGLRFPEHCLASHVNMIVAKRPQWSQNPILAAQHGLSRYTRREKEDLERLGWFSKESSGYMAEQSTRPQTLGFALADSPVALLAWIYEKLHDWTDSYPWTDDEICTWVSIYWFSTAGPAASIRIYYESTHVKPNEGTTRAKTQAWVPHVKLGLVHFPKELMPVPRAWARTLGPVAYEREHTKGGHFAAWEQPESIAGDLEKMFGKGGPCYSIIPRKTGYDGSDGGRAHL